MLILEVNSAMSPFKSSFFAVVFSVCSLHYAFPVASSVAPRSICHHVPDEALDLGKNIVTVAPTMADCRSDARCELRHTRGVIFSASLLIEVTTSALARSALGCMLTCRKS